MSDDSTALTELTVLIPAWNEKDCITGVLDEFEGKPELKGLRILVVDDGSTDGTAQVLDDYCAKHPGTAALHRPHGNKDRALWAGFAAVETAWTGMMDGDGQYDPADFAALMKSAAKSGADAVWGIRGERHDHALRFISSWIGRTTKRIALGGQIVSDTGCGIWIARSRYLKPIPPLAAEPAGQVHCHVPELIATQGGKVIEQNIAHRSRHGGTAKFGALNRIGPGLRSLSQASAVRRALAGAAKKLAIAGRTPVDKAAVKE